jgi:hypothetical protein
MRFVSLVGLFGTSLLLSLILITANVTWAQSNIWHVATTGSDITGDGSEINPFATIQHAIDVAKDGDTISVGQGSYFENVSVTQKYEIHIKGAGASVTKIHGLGNGHVVVFNVGSGSINGFTISNSGNEPGYSAGIFTSQALVYIEDNIIADNNNGITASSYSYVVIRGNRIMSNTGLSALSLMTSSAGMITNNIIAHNTGRGIEGTPSYVVNNTIADNGTFGMMLIPSGAITVRNNIIVNHHYGIYVSGREQSAVPSVRISYNDVWNNLDANYWETFGTVSPTVYPANIISRPFEPQPGTGEIHVLPLFVESDNGDYHLQCASPCIDAGDPNDNYFDEPEPNGYRIDIGAYGNTSEARCAYNSRVYLPAILHQ